MLIFCSVDRLRLSKSDDTYGGVSHTTIISEEMVHGFSCQWNQSVIVVYMMEKVNYLSISSYLLYRRKA
jgi:hypothetical protein